MVDWKYPGARWWKFDFHTHTPASYDFKDCKISAEAWLREFMEKGIDCVAVTDHNSGEWIDKLKQKLDDLNQEKPAWYRPIYLFPGVEISANGGVHVLAIFGKDKNTSDIDSLLGSVGYYGTKGASDTVTEKSLTRVIDLISEAHAIPIPAHVDKRKGLFKESGGETLGQVLNNPNIYAMELCNEAYTKPGPYKSNKISWTEVVGSDLHGFQKSKFGTFTWVKMDEPSIEGLRLALIDGPVSVSRDMGDDPNRHAEFVIEKVIIDKAKYIGKPDPVNCQFNPFLNTIIGGRGSGKSTLLEFMRFVFRREREMPKSLQEESRKYFGKEKDYLLTDQSKISLIYRKGDVRYRLSRSLSADGHSLEVENEQGKWVDSEGEIQSLFPVYIYSQKQIFELAREPQALLRIIDKACEVEYEEFKNKEKELENKYKQNARELQEVERGISQRIRLQGELEDLERQITRIEKSGHKNVLRDYRKRNQQINEIKVLQDEWMEMSEWLQNNQDKMTPPEIKEEFFSDHPDILTALNKINDKWQAFNEKFILLAREAQAIIKEWEKEKRNSDWIRELTAELSKYEELREKFEEQGIEPNKYPLLLTKQKAIQGQLDDIRRFISKKDELMKKKETLEIEVKENREILTKNRRSFLEDVLRETKDVYIEVIPFLENRRDAEKSIRSILQCNDHRFQGDITHLMSKYLSGSKSIQTLEGIQNIKNAIIEIRSEKADAQDYRFASHLRSLPQESMDDLMLWFPDDGLDITFDHDNKKIQSGSPGQRNAALLAFILSYGDEPLLLDQPEDDLDNELIYNLIVQQLRGKKRKRQIIVITHNANIVVNGNAEMVLPMVVRNGQSHIEDPASIQNGRTREKICNILEGGKQAFEQRYRRIHLERKDV